MNGRSLSPGQALQDALGRPVVNLDDYRTAARQVLAPEIFDYIEGGAGDEVTLQSNREDFSAIRLRPLVFRDVAKVDLTWSGPLGSFAMPIGLSPTALHRLVDSQGEIATARAANGCGAPMIVSMMSSCTVEEIAEQSGHQALWLQTYLLKDRQLGRDLVLRAEAAGYRAIVVTAGCPVVGKRDRNLVNQFRLPDGIAPANFGRNDQVSHNNPIQSFDGADLDASASWTDLEAMIRATRLPVLIKGLINPRDVEPALAAGAAGLIVSNHGGRQLDTTVSTIRALPGIVDAVAGRVPVLMDGGVRRGTDALKALALGADAVLLGSSTLWALSVGGEQGVRSALSLIGDELRNALTLVGCSSLAELRREASGILG